MAPTATLPVHLSPEQTRSGGPSEDEVRGQLTTVLASDQFSTSRRASEFLQFISERALHGDVEALKERLLGIEIFHRRSDYDTSSDAIVRVTANDVRRRLTSFEQAHPHESIRILLPPGSYVPDFIRRSGSYPLEPKEASIPVQETAAAQTLHPPSSDTIVEPKPPHRSELPERVKDVGLAPAGFHFRVPMVAAVSLTLGVLATLGVSTIRARKQASAYSFYSDLLGPIGNTGGEQTEIALSNPRVLLYRGSVSAVPEKEDELAQVSASVGLSAQLNATANDTQGNFPFHYLQVDDKNYTGLGEAEAAFGLAEVLKEIGRSAHLTQARFLNWDAAREEQVVLLGAPHMSAFAQSSLSENNFLMEHDAIRDLHPEGREQPIYKRELNGTALVDYGLIWMGKSPAGSRILVLAGLTSTGTAGVGRFFADPTSMKAVYDRLRSMSHSKRCPDSWQVLLRVDAREDVPVRIQPIAMRVLEQ